VTELQMYLMMLDRFRSENSSRFLLEDGDKYDFVKPSHSLYSNGNANVTVDGAISLI
jgi:hypothetical protein